MPKAAKKIPAKKPSAKHPAIKGVNFMPAPVTPPAEGKRLREALRETVEKHAISYQRLAKDSGVAQRIIRLAVENEGEVSDADWLKLAAACPVGTPLRAALAARLPGIVEAAKEKAHAVRLHGQALPDGARISVPLSKIRPGQNYRTSFDGEEIETLATSILASGVLQNLVVLPADLTGVYEIAAGGERRYRACQLLLKRKAIPADFPVPILIKDMAPDEALAASIAENLIRVDVHPVEQAEGFCKLRDMFGWKTARIAEYLGGKDRLRFVQQRLNVTDKLSDAARKAFHDDAITLDQARALWALPKGLQDKDFEETTSEGLDAGDIRRYAASACASGNDALFKVEDYTGETYTDNKVTRFVDVEQFAKLQDAAIKATIDALKATWSDVKIVHGHYIDTSGYATTKDRKKGIAFVRLQVPSSSQPYAKIEVREGYCLRASTFNKSHGADGAAAIVSPQALGLAKRQLQDAHALKTIELQNSMVFPLSTNPARVAMAVTIIGIIAHAQYAGRENSVKISHVQHDAADLGRTGTPADTLLARLLSNYVERKLVVLSNNDDGALQQPRIPLAATAEAFKVLVNDPALEQIFAAVIAREVGSFPGYSPTYGDDDLVVAIADFTGASLAGRWRMTEAYLEPFKKDQLVRVALASIGAADFITPNMKKKDVIAAIMAHPDRKPEWLAPEMIFAPHGDAAALVGTMLDADLTELVAGRGPSEEEDEDFEAEPDEAEQDGDDEFADDDAPADDVEAA